MFIELFLLNNRAGFLPGFFVDWPKDDTDALLCAAAAFVYKLIIALSCTETIHLWLRHTLDHQGAESRAHVPINAFCIKLAALH